jgi:hypothetical protein
MPRSDVRSLDVPDMPPASPGVIANLTQPDLPSVPEPPRAAVEAPKPERCPHCSARLSALELKLERCTGCGKGLGAGSARTNVGI